MRQKQKMTREGEVEREGRQTDRRTRGRGKRRKAWAEEKQKDFVTSSE